MEVASANVHSEKNLWLHCDIEEKEWMWEILKLLQKFRREIGSLALDGSE